MAHPIPFCLSISLWAVFLGALRASPLSEIARAPTQEDSACRNNVGVCDASNGRSEEAMRSLLQKTTERKRSKGIGRETPSHGADVSPQHDHQGSKSNDDLDDKTVANASGSDSGKLVIAQTNLKLLGLQHTGTHLLDKVLMNGFGASIPVHDPNLVSVEKCGFWKHACLSDLKANAPSHFDGCASDSFVGLAMIRNPLSWLQALRRSDPYELGECVQGEEWHSKSCTFAASCESSYRCMSKLPEVTYPNIEAIWSRWNKDYETLERFFPSHLLIRYEDLVQDPEKVLRQVGRVGNLTVAANVQPVLDAAQLLGSALASNAHGVPTPGLLGNVRDEALEDIRSRSYLEKYSDEELQQVCKQLDIDLMHRHGYNDCDEVLKAPA